MTTLVTSPPPPTSLPLHSSSLSYLALEGPPLQVLAQHELCLYLYLQGLSAFPHLGHLFHTCQTRIKRKLANQKPEQLHRSHMVFVLNWLLCIFKNVDTISSVLFTLLLFSTVSKEWSKYTKILEREDREFETTMREEGSTLFSFKFNSKQQSFGWGWYYCPT